ncbi:hypothetical protein H1C71_019834 [Ictidomys tridecemlineatus]|nr:hypothetical protein H1C71_019834 [Ictidomys tridecemlineatus]
MTPFAVQSLRDIISIKLTTFYIGEWIQNNRDSDLYQFYNPEEELTLPSHFTYYMNQNEFLSSKATSTLQLLRWNKLKFLFDFSFLFCPISTQSINRVFYLIILNCFYTLWNKIVRQSKLC